MPSGHVRLIHITSREYSSVGKWNPRMREVPFNASSAKAMSGVLKEAEPREMMTATCTCVNDRLLLMLKLGRDWRTDT